MLPSLPHCSLEDTSGSPTHLSQCPQSFPPLSCASQRFPSVLPSLITRASSIPPADAGDSALLSQGLCWPKEASKLRADEHIGRANAQH